MRAANGAGFLALLFAAGCPPTLTGAKCDNDCNCPSDQTCASGACALGANRGCANADAGQDAGLTDGGGFLGTDAGSDAGAAPLSGVVTLNGGVDKPQMNAASVSAWDHLPSGLGNTAQLRQMTDSSGNFAFPNAVPGTTYYLLATYALSPTQLRSMPQVSTGFVAGSAAAQSIDLDVPTLQCFSYSLFFESGSAGSSGDYIETLYADISDIRSGTELEPSHVTSAVATGVGGSTVDLLLLTMNPFEQGFYAWVPSGPTADLAIAGAYSFQVIADGYKSGTCAIDNMTMTTGPSAITVMNRALAVQSISITWESPPGTDINVIQVLDKTGAKIQLSQDSFPQDAGSEMFVDLPANTFDNTDCPGLLASDPSCTLNVYTFHAQVQAQGTAFEGAAGSTTFHVN